MGTGSVLDPWSGGAGPQRTAGVTQYSYNSIVTGTRLYSRPDSLTLKWEAMPVPAIPLTTPPGSHWFGYYDKWQFNAGDNLVLGMRSAFDLRPPTAADEIELGVMDLEEPGRPWRSLGRTQAWNWQAGCMLQWVPGDRDICIWNEIADGQFRSRVLELHGTSRVLPHPIFTLHPDGQTALTIDFHRLEDLRPGYGYYGSRDPNFDARAPADAGIWRMDLATGASQLIVSLAEIAAIPYPGGDISGAKHYFNVLICNPSGSRFLFLHRWREQDGPFMTRLVTADMDGTNVRVVDHSGYTSHLIWQDDCTILAWSRVQGRGAGFYLFPDGDGPPRPLGHEAMPLNGHCTYLPGVDWVLNDTYPQGPQRLQELYLFHVPTATRRDLGTFPAPAAYRDEVRCDLHPRSNRKGTQVIIDSAHGGQGRQMYLLDIAAVRAEMG